MQFSHRLLTWPYAAEAILDVQPAPSGNWAVLAKTGAMAIIDEFGVELSSRALNLDGLDLSKFVMLRLSRDRRFAAVAEQFGTRGSVTDLTSGKVLMQLTRSDYQVAHCSFPLAFFDHEGRTLLVHATDWNRLDLSDPLTGACLSDRPSPQYERGRPTPEQYLDYFHSRLTVSPDQKRIFDNGWIWHPYGIPRTWSLDAWANGNPWESEDDGSVRQLQTGGRIWDAPMAWIDDNRVVVWGLGEDYEEDNPLRPGVRIFDVISGEEQFTIEGVQIEPHHLWPRNPPQDGWLAFDKWLFAVSPKTGTTVWDLKTRHCLHRDPELTPRLYHPSTQCFLSLEGVAARVSSLLLG